MKIIEYHQNGKIKNVYHSLNNKLHGINSEYYETGHIYSTSHYLNGKLNGRTDFYYKNGILKAFNLFKKDSLYYLYGNSIDSIQVDVIYPIITWNWRKGTGDTTLRVIINIPNDSLFPYSFEEVTISSMLVKGTRTNIEHEFTPLYGNFQDSILFYLDYSIEDMGLYELYGTIKFKTETLESDSTYFYSSKSSYILNEHSLE